MRADPIPIVFCSQCLADGDWRTVHSNTLKVRNRPKLIVVAERPECSLWTEALHLGVYELLLLPLEKNEVERVMLFCWEAKCLERDDDHDWRPLKRAGT